MRPMFLNELDVRAVDDGYMLLHEFRYITMHGNHERVICVPEGFVTNFASVPAAARAFISGHGKDRWAATVHDYLYSQKYARHEADAIFLEALEVSKVGWLKRHAMYRAVRLAGWMFH
jgi:hypothetical protein